MAPYKANYSTYTDHNVTFFRERFPNQNWLFCLVLALKTMKWKFLVGS